MRRLLVVVLLLAAAAAAYLYWTRPRGEAAVEVFFTRAAGNASTLAQVSRTVPDRSVESRLRGGLEALLAGPTEAERAAGLGSEVPAATRLLGLTVRDGVARADFSAELGSGGGSSSMLGRVWQIVYTATQFADAPAVRILIEGKEAEALGGEGILIDRPISRPAAPPTF